MVKDKLFTQSYFCILAANFLLYFGFYLLLPVLPFYLVEVFHSSNAMVGIVLSSYTVAALCIRPFSGFIIDTIARKPLYLLAYFLFTAVFAGYLLAGALTLFTMLRVIHGIAFGTVTVGGNTLVIDITPSSRRGEAIGYYGLMNNMAMSIGPMVGLFLHDMYSFQVIFICALVSCALGFIMATIVKAPPKIPVKSEPISLDRFILLKGLPAGLDLLLLSIPYGITTSYIAMYAKQMGVTGSTGYFFTLMAVGMAISRLFSGKLVDKGKITEVISTGMILVLISFSALALNAQLTSYSNTLGSGLFFSTALFLGIGFGIMFPAFNTLFVNLAPNSKRGTANSTYLTSWDVGIGIGVLAGGYIGEITTFDKAYMFGSALTLIAVIYFIKKVTPHFHKNKIR
jgi:Arabinose efflux permease